MVGYSLFSFGVAVEGNDFCKSLVFSSTPEYSPEIQRMLLFLLDTHHVLVNSRALVCSKGIPDGNIQRKAWQAVAKRNSTALNIVMVDDLLDKQSNSMAKITYSQEVEDKMKQLHFDKEAEFCHLMRNWYEVEDEPSITADEQFHRRINLCNFLLEDISFTQFPPYGSHIRGIPYVMFEGLMTNIDRRIQMHAIVAGG